MFLQKGLGHVHLDQSLSLRDSNELIELLKDYHGREHTIFSMDITDLFYLLEQSCLRKRVKGVLKLNLVRFQSQSGISIGNFLFKYYLQSTVVEYGGKKYKQKEGCA